MRPTGRSCSRPSTSARSASGRGNWAFNQWSNGDEELYDLDNDPYELKNLLVGSGASSYTDTRDQLAAELAKLKTCSGPSCHLGG